MSDYFIRRDIVCLAGADWDTPLWTNRQHIMSRLSRNNRVLYIESIGSRTPNFASAADWRKILAKIKRIFSPLRKINGNLYVLTPFIIPYHNNRFADFVNERLLVFYVRFARGKLGFRRPILWSYLPHAVWLLGGMDFDRAIYHCVDEYAAIPGAPAKKLKTLEESFLKRCDAVFATSKKLYESKKAGNKNTFYLPNVSDFAHFSKAGRPDTAIPDDLKGIKRPVIGYIGNLCDHKVDLDLVIYAAKALPGDSFVLIGPIWENNSEINQKIGLAKRQKNIFLLGLRQYDILPNYIKGFDVCMIPHKVTPYSQASFPIKLHEFLASGKPIVTTNLPSLSDYDHMIYMAGSQAEFAAKIGEALAEKNPLVMGERIAVASRNTWESRIESMEKIMKGL